MRIAGNYKISCTKLYSSNINLFIYNNIRSDWLLKFLYRTLSMQAGGVAGLQAIELDSNKIENFDLTDIVSGNNKF